jgi:hypothetical protein
MMRINFDGAYLRDVNESLSRILALFDRDVTSQSYGMGDRYFWAWGLIDFGNATFQGAAHGLARLWVSGLWPYQTTSKIFISRIDSMFEGVSRLTRSDGSLEEAFPREGSYCVTALVAFDLLVALDLLEPELEKEQLQKWQDIIAPLIAYLIESDETHAVISNHLATAIAALVRWQRLRQCKKGEAKALMLLDRILSNQSGEGWFKEYEGADPGYQSLCTYYLADIHKIRPDLNLIEPLRRSILFLWHFAHPDGSFGGVYGSRCTRFYYPAGIAALGDEIPEAKSLAMFMEKSILNKTVVTLSSMDEPNIVPMFNSYVWATVLQKSNLLDPTNDAYSPEVPCLLHKQMRKSFPEAGIVIDRGVMHYTIIGTHKGGVVYHFVKNRLALIDAGLVFRNRRKSNGSTQVYNRDNLFKQGDQIIQVTAKVAAMPKQLPGPFQFVLLRVLCLTVFRFVGLREWVKRRLVGLLITRRKFWPVVNKRIIYLGEDLKIEDKTEKSDDYEKVEYSGIFVPIHMASQGYWQRQDEEETL